MGDLRLLHQLHCFTLFFYEYFLETLPIDVFLKVVNIGLSLRNTVFMRDVPIEYYKPDLSRKAEHTYLSLTLLGLETTQKDSTRLYIK